MHIPSELLGSNICPVTAVLAATAVGSSAYALSRTTKMVAPKKFALVGAVIFALQMLNFPIWQGISGHFVGGVLAASLLGIPGGILTMALVLTVQTVLFADGGVNALGVNILNMSVICAGLGGLLRLWFLKKIRSESAATGLAAAAALMLAAGMILVELALDGKATGAVVASLLSTHALLALAEGMVTVALFKLLATVSNQKFVYTSAAVVLLAILVAPFASAFPDALEWNITQFNLLSQNSGTVLDFSTPLADYAMAGIANATLACYAAALCGVVVIGLALSTLAACVAKR